MKVLIVVESMFGNTELLARAVKEGVELAGGQATVRDVRDMSSTPAPDCDLLVVGAPTHAFSLSRRRTRADAVRQGAEAARAGIGVREWLPTLDSAFRTRTGRPPVAVFDSRVSSVRRFPGSAARRAGSLLRALGLTLVTDPLSFYVVDVKGPLADGEEARARAWGARLAHTIGARPDEARSE